MVHAPRGAAGLGGAYSPNKNTKKIAIFLLFPRHFRAFFGVFHAVF
jgi:hypothetical protein